MMFQIRRRLNVSGIQCRTLKMVVRRSEYSFDVKQNTRYNFWQVAIFKVFDSRCYYRGLERLQSRIEYTMVIILAQQHHVVCCCKLNNTRDWDEHIFGQVSTCTDRYQLTVFRCTNVHPQRYARPYLIQQTGESLLFRSLPFLCINKCT